MARFGTIRKSHFAKGMAMSLVRLRRAAQLTLPQDIRVAARLREGDYLEAEVTAGGAILLKPVSIAQREPTDAEDAEISGVVDQERRAYAAERRR